MVNPSIVYQEIELSSGEKWIIAKDLVPKIMAQLELGFTVKSEFKGKKMEGWTYENPLAKELDLGLDEKKSYRVVLSGRYVTTEEGTGLVHCAPGHGKEDFEVGNQAGLEMPCPVNINGLLTKETGKYAGKKARVVDKEIIEDLEKSGNLVYKLKYTHDYPLCWRCKSSLLMISQPQWFLKISEIHKKLLKRNEEVNWVPSWMKLRMKAWLEGISDWPVSRERYWGTPLPIWTCNKCEETIVVGSVKELEKLSKQKAKGLHKPEIDNINIDCKCGNKMSRVPDVLDVWFDSGVSSWAALGYMNDKKNFEKFWPANLNIEGKDQFRGWWNSQLILSEIKFDKKPMENIVVHGMVLDIGKKKMSKSLGNILSPKEVIEKYNRDYFRYYFAKVSKGEDFAFNESEFKEIEKFLRVLSNVNNFINQLEPEPNKNKKNTLKIEDKWILSKFNSFIQEVSEKYDSFKLPEVVLLIEDFLVNDLSKTYIKIIRDRADETFEVLNEIRIGLLKILSPIIPFTTEKIWQGLKDKKIFFIKEESIHLTDWPKVDKKKINPELEKQFQLVLQIIEKGLAERDRLQIGLKWPLSKAVVNCDKEIDKNLQEIIERQLNVKKIELKKTKELNVELDSVLTTELEAEGFAREISRKIQSERKNAGLVKTDKIELQITGDLAEIVPMESSFLKQRVNAKSIKFAESDIKFKYSSDGNIKNKSYFIKFNKI